MRWGAGAVLVVGAIATFGFGGVAIGEFDLARVGWIAMAAGLVALVVGVIDHAQRAGGDGVPR